MFEELEKDLCEITGYDNISFQPNRSVMAQQSHEKTCLGFEFFKMLCAFAHGV